MNELKQLKDWMMKSEIGSYENNDSFELWNAIIIKIDELLNKKIK